MESPESHPVSELGVREFERLRDLIRLASGIALGDSKRALVESRLSGRIRQLGLADFSAYCDLLLQPGAGEVGHMVNAVTTNLTGFFRERHHFDTLTQRLAQETSSMPARIWSAACSTGEEPYSIAITAAMAGRPGTKILATDIDTSVLALARQAIYRENAIEGLPLPIQRRGFLRGKMDRKGWVRVRDDLRDAVRFAPLNLVAPEWPVKPPLDAIFCRNVLIYFDPATQQAVVGRMVRLLRPGGLLFLGHAESQAGRHESLAPAGVTTYERRAGPDPDLLAQAGLATGDRYE